MAFLVDSSELPERRADVVYRVPEEALDSRSCDLRLRPRYERNDRGDILRTES